MKGHPWISSVAQLRLYGLSINCTTRRFNLIGLIFRTKKVKLIIYRMKCASEPSTIYCEIFLRTAFKKITKIKN